ncbi:MAG: hypothetical protein HYU97_06845 [Deltaproteobacteria bacterium]|nr:hypothetical protein [Deltaproteobacteria bacterium]
MANPVDRVTIGEFTFIDNSSTNGDLKPDGLVDFIQVGKGRKQSPADLRTNLRPVYQFLQAEGFSIQGGRRLHPTKTADLRVADGLLKKRAELLAPGISDDRVKAIIGEFRKSKKDGVITDRFTERTKEQIVQKMPKEARETYIREQKTALAIQTLKSIAKVFVQSDLTPQARKEAQQALVQVDDFINQERLVLPEAVAQLHVALVGEYLSGYKPASSRPKQVVPREPRPESAPMSFQYDRYVAVDSGKGKQGFDGVPDAAHILRGKGKIRPTQLSAVKRFLASKGIKILKEDMVSYARAREAYQLRIKIDEAVKAGDYFGVKDAVAQLESAYADIASDKSVAKKERWALQQLHRASSKVLVDRFARHLEKMVKSGDPTRLDEEIRHFRAFAKALPSSVQAQVEQSLSEVVQKVGKKCLGYALNKVSDEVYANPSNVEKARKGLAEVKKFARSYPTASNRVLNGWAKRLEDKLPITPGQKPGGEIARG